MSLIIARELAEQGITMSPENPVRFVTHRDISSEDIATFLTNLASVLSLLTRLTSIAIKTRASLGKLYFFNKYTVKIAFDTC